MEFPCSFLRSTLFTCFNDILIALIVNFLTRQRWDTAQAICSYITGTLATQAVFKVVFPWGSCHSLHRAMVLVTKKLPQRPRQLCGSCATSAGILARLHLRGRRFLFVRFLHLDHVTSMLTIREPTSTTTASSGGLLQISSMMPRFSWNFLPP